MYHNRNTYEYKKWRKRVLQRDGYKCTMCGSTKHLEAHHIMPVADYPELALDVGNGKTLCTRCHYLMDGREYDEYKEYKREYDHQLSYSLKGVQSLTYWLKYRLEIIRDLVIIFPGMRKLINKVFSTIGAIALIVLLYLISCIKDLFS